MRRPSDTAPWNPVRRHRMWVRGLRSRLGGRRERVIRQPMCFLSLRPLERVLSLQIPISLWLQVRNDFRKTVEVIRREARMARESYRGARSASFGVRPSPGLGVKPDDSVGAFPQRAPVLVPPSSRDLDPPIPAVRAVPIRHERATITAGARERGSPVDPPALPGRAPTLPHTEKPEVGSEPMPSVARDREYFVRVQREFGLGIVNRHQRVTRLDTIAPMLEHLRATAPINIHTCSRTTTVPSEPIRSRTDVDRRPSDSTEATLASSPSVRNRVEITPLKAVRRAEATGLSPFGASQDPVPLVVRKTPPSPPATGETDPLRDEPRLRQQITETVERTVREVVERRFEPDSRLGRRLAGHLRSQLYEDLVFERERLGVG